MRFKLLNDKVLTCYQKTPLELNLKILIDCHIKEFTEITFKQSFINFVT